ncbi:UPF0236 family transposase-like protein [Priestia endophytica]|uniref:UPF0236 family transposase-like protein n=1 Tax=Priestia endophytica TaxID=135735 RepID=UPI0021F45782|nr:UPF0236 family protein [Priestia endophytica]
MDGLCLKRQEKNKKGNEEKIAAVHQGWEVNGKRVSLKGKRHFHHQGTGRFWEDFETFLVDTFDYDPDPSARHQRGWGEMDNVLP